MTFSSRLLLAIPVLLGLGAGHAAARNDDAARSYRVSELRQTSVPVPSARPAAMIDESKAPAREAAPVEKVRRTADGIRIVGPRFFPAN